jgi:hypothetical protein
MEGTLMASDPNAPRSRRALLTAAAGAAGAVAASAALPLTVAAAPANMQTESNNATVAETSVTQATDGQIAFRAKATNAGAAGLAGTTGDTTNIATDTSFTGIYGFSPTNPDPDFFATGVWGDSDDVGTYGLGEIGVMGDGAIGVVGRADLGGYGVQALNFDPTGVALRVDGKVLFSRSGRSTIGAGKSALKVNLNGVSSASRIFAVLHSNRTGRYVRAVVPTTGSFTIYLNTTVTSATYIAWFIIN